MRIKMPASWAVEGYGVPEVCAHHGRPGSPQRVAMTVYPSWTWLFLLIGVFTFFLVRFFTAKTLVLPDWPVCDRCESGRRTAFTVSGVLLLLGVAAVVVSGVTQGSVRSLLPAGALLILAGLIALAWTPWATVAGVQTDEALLWVTVTHVHPEFEARFAPFRAQLQQELQDQVHR